MDETRRVACGGAAEAEVQMAVQSGRHPTAPTPVDVAEPQGTDAVTASTAPPAFVGRERELAVLRQSLAHLPAVVLVEGEAGIGKSRLIQEFLATSRVGRQRPLVGVCPPYREPATLAPVVDALRHACDDVKRVELSPLAGALRPLFPEWADGLPPTPEPLDDAQAARHRLFAALGELMGALRTSLLVVEDVHWADEATLEFLLFLVAQQYFEQMGMVVSYRLEEISESSLLFRLSSRLPAGVTQERIAVQPLDVADTAALVSSMLDGERVSDEFATFLCERTDGLPLAIEESVRLLEDRADLIRRDGEWARHGLDVLHVPPTVRDATLERVQRLGPAAQRILEAAAVLSEKAYESTIIRVAGLSAPAARAGLSEAFDSHLLEEDTRSRLGFRHALSAQAVYETIPAPKRSELHLRAGEALETATPQPLVQLARHFREAHDPGRWCQYAEQAADVAVSSGDHTTALVLLNGLLSGADLPVPDRGRLARKLANVALQRRALVGGLLPHVVRTLRGVLDAPGLGPKEEAQVRSRLGRLLNQMGESEASHAELERAIPHLDDPADAAHAIIYLAWPRATSWHARVHLKWLQRASALVEQCPSPLDRLSLTVNQATALLFLGEQSGWAAAAELPTSASSSREWDQIARASLNIGYAAIVWGRYAEARQRLRAALELADAERHLRFRYNVVVSQAHLDWFTGAWEGLSPRLVSLADAEDFDPVPHLEAALVAGALNWAQGNVRSAEERFRFVLEETQRRRLADMPLEPAAALARLSLAGGEVDEALRVTDEPVNMLATKGIWVWATDIAPVRVEALLAAGRDDEAEQLVTAFARGLRGRDAPAPRAALLLCRANLAVGRADYARAAAGFARAATAWDTLPRPYDALLARDRKAHCLIAAGKAENGLALLSEVFPGLTDLGASGDADRVAHDLRGHGVDVRRRPVGRPGYGDRLSPRELEVVELLVTGKTDREIAEVLFVSRKTVTSHLASARRKLKVHSRTALAVAAIEAGIVRDVSSTYNP